SRPYTEEVLHAVNTYKLETKVSFLKSRWTMSWSVVMLLAIAFLTGCGSAPEATTGNPGKGGGGKGGGKGKGGANGPVPVVVAKVTPKNVPIELQVVGNVEPYSTVSIRPQVSGQLTSVAIQDGDFVKKGAPLFTIDPGVLNGQMK